MEQTKNKKAIIYCRVSTQEQVDTGGSLTTQERICRDYALKNGYEIVAEPFIEEGESAKTALRPELQKMLKYCAQNQKEVDALIIYKIDRLSRNTDDYSFLRMFFAKYDIKIISTSEKFEDNPVGRFIENTMANVAQLDNDIRAERTKNGMIEATRAGRYTFRAPFGYTKGMVNGEKNIVINDDKAKFIKRVFELLATGLYSQEEARQIINKEGAKINDKYLSKQYFYKLTRNKIYKGIVDAFDLGEIRGSFEPIVSDELFDRVQYIITKKGKRQSGYVVDNPDFPLRNFVVSEQGHKMDGAWAKGNGRNKLPYYRFRGLNGYNTHKEVLEDKFRAFTKQYEYSAKYADLLNDAIKLNWEQRNQSGKKTKNQNEKKITELKQKQGLVIEKNLNGVIPDNLLKEQLERINTEIGKLTDNVQDYTNLDNVQEVLDYSLWFMQNLSTETEKLEIERRKKLQRFLFPQGIIFDGQKLRTIKTALILELKETSQQEKSPYVDYCIENLHPLVQDIKRWFKSIPVLKGKIISVST